MIWHRFTLGERIQIQQQQCANNSFHNGLFEVFNVFWTSVRVCDDRETASPVVSKLYDLWPVKTKQSRLMTRSIQVVASVWMWAVSSLCPKSSFSFSDCLVWPEDVKISRVLQNKRPFCVIVIYMFLWTDGVTKYWEWDVQTDLYTTGHSFCYHNYYTQLMTLALDTDKD